MVMRRTLTLGLALAFLAWVVVIPVISAAADDRIVGSEYWVSSLSAADGKPLKVFLWEKRLKDADLKQFGTSGKVVLLAHGATTPGSLAFDFQGPEKSELTYSLMDYLAERGFDVFALDYQNYGRSDKHECGICVTTQVAANDINAAVDYIRGLRGVERVYLLGWSWGTTTTGLFTMQRPHKVRRLVLYAPPVWRGTRNKPPTREFRTVTEDGAKNLFEPEATDPQVIAAFAKEAVSRGPNAPNGVLMDLNVKMPITDPKQIPAPTMIILGDLDRLTPVTQPELPGFFADLPNPDKQLVIVPGAGHGLIMQKPRLRFFTEVAKWFSIDQPGWRMEVVTDKR
jgi:pimeloyl-ACP methyl ester carboxylesterase